MFKLVLIDDDAEVLAINQKYLTGAGFTVYTAISPREGVLSIRKNLPDCILLDVMLPEADGYRVCRYIRSFSSVPILFLTARSSEEDVIRGLTCGGDDYLVKPYSLRELKARVDLLIRRRRQLAQASSDLVLTIGNLSIDRVAHKAFYREQDLCLANREYEVLLYLAEHPDRDITFEELGTALFGVYQESDRRSVMVNVSRLRKRFEGNYELENRIEPFALRMIKAGLNAELDGQSGIQELAGDATLLYYLTDEAQEGKNAFLEKRKPNFKQYPKFP